MASLGGLLFYTSHLVLRLYLLKGGKKVGVVTHGLFGIERILTIDLAKLSSNTTRSNKLPHVSFKKNCKLNALLCELVLVVLFI